MTLQIGRVSIRVSPLFAALIALLLITDRSHLMPLSLAAVLLHELGHLLALRLTGQRIRRIDLRPGAVEIRHTPATPSSGGEALVAAAGILMNALAAAVAYGIGRAGGSQYLMIFAALNAALGLFSLCPVAGLDGGDLLRLLLARFLPEPVVRRISLTVSMLLIGLMIVAGGFLLLTKKGNLSLLLCGVYLLFLMLISGKSGKK